VAPSFTMSGGGWGEESRYSRRAFVFPACILVFIGKKFKVLLYFMGSIQATTSKAKLSTDTDCSVLPTPLNKDLGLQQYCSYKTFPPTLAVPKVLSTIS